MTGSGSLPTSLVDLSLFLAYRTTARERGTLRQPTRLGGRREEVCLVVEGAFIAVSVRIIPQLGYAVVLRHKVVGQARLDHDRSLEVRAVPHPFLQHRPVLS